MLFTGVEVGSVVRFGLLKTCFVRGISVGLLLVTDLARMINHVS